MTQQEKYDQLYEEIKAINDEKQGIIKKLQRGYFKPSKVKFENMDQPWPYTPTIEKLI